MNLFGNNDCVSRKIKRNLKLEEVTPENDSTFKSYQISYAGTKLDSLINIPKDKFIKDIQLGYSNASLNEDGTINVGDGLKKDLIVFSICTEEGYTLKLILLPHGTVTGEELTEKLATKADLENGKVPNSQLNIDASLSTKSNNTVTNSAISTYFNLLLNFVKKKLDILTIDTSLNAGSSNPISNSAVTNKFNEVNSRITRINVPSLCNIWDQFKETAKDEYKTPNEWTLKKLGKAIWSDNDTSDKVVQLEIGKLVHVDDSNDFMIYSQKHEVANDLVVTAYATLLTGGFLLTGIGILKHGSITNAYNYNIGYFKIYTSYNTNQTYGMFQESSSLIDISYGDSYESVWYKLSNSTKLFRLLYRSLYFGILHVRDNTIVGLACDELGDLYKIYLKPGLLLYTEEPVFTPIISIDTELNSSSNNPIANSAVTNNFVKRICISELKSRTALIQDIMNYESSLNSSIHSYPIIATFETITDDTTNTTTDVHNCVFYANKQRGATEIYFTGIPCYNSNSSDNSIRYELHVSILELKLASYNNNLTTSLYTDTFDSDFIKDSLIKLYDGKSDIIVRTKAIKLEGSTISLTDSLNSFIGIFNGETNPISFMEVGTNTKVYNIGLRPLRGGGYMLSLKNSLDLTTLNTDVSENTAKINDLAKLAGEIMGSQITDVSNLTTKLNTKMPVINGGSYQEDEASKKTLITNVNNNTYYDTDGTGVCTINFNNGVFGGSSISNANLVAKVYKVTADNTIEIRGTVTGKYTISGQPKGSLTGDVDGTDDISYVKHYDFDLKWNTSTNKEISYTCKELNVQADLLDILSYGVRWNSTKSSSPACQRIGNLQMHRDLPIQNALKGCVVKYSADKKPEIQYYLDENDWRFRKDPIVLKDVTLTSTRGASVDNCTITDNVFSTLQYKNQYFKIISSTDKPSYVGDIYKITDIDTSTKTATAENTHLNDISTQAGEGGSLTGDIELGSCLNGYDGEVMVEVPEFYIRSWEKDNGDKEVRISQVRIDDTWEKQPHCLISPYCVTLLREVPENMGYLSTLTASTAISVCNTETYCRGGNNSTSLDQYLTTDPFRTNLGKPTTSTARSTMRTACRKSKNKEVMSYNQYKRICYWLYVIEYANFNSQLAYNSKLDLNGFKQGGLGNGVTNIGSEWTFYNSYNPITYNGYTNSLGNGTGRILMTTTMPKNKDNTATVTYNNYVPRWHGIENLFGDIWKNVDGIIINSSSITKDGKLYSEVYTTDNPELYSDNDYNSMNKVGVELNEAGYIKEIYLGDTAEIMPILNDASNATYKCDYHHINSPAGLRTLILGSYAYSGSSAGLGCFCSHYSVSVAYADFGFRSSSNLE